MNKSVNKTVSSYNKRSLTQFKLHPLAKLSSYTIYLLL